MSKVTRVRLESGIEIECEEAGSGARPFVLVHGFTGSRDDWREQMAPLSELGRTLAPDNRGHGGSSNTGDPASYRLDQLVDDLAQVLDRLDAERIDLLGHSLGGMVALRFTLAHPERVASLVLMDTAARAVEILPRQMMANSGAFARAAGMATLAKAMRNASRERGAATPASEATVQAMGFDVWWDRIDAKLHAMDPEAFATLGLELSDQEDLRGRLGEIACPTTVLVGDQDAPFRDPSEELVAGIAGAKLVVIPDAAHSPQLESPARWLAAVRDHLNRARGLR